MTAPLEYLRDPAEITRLSFATLRAEADFSALPPDVARLAERVVHACGMPEILPDLAWGSAPGEAAAAALAKGAPVFCDCKAVGVGITASRLPAANPVIVTIDDVSLPRRARQLGTTRSAAQLDLWLPLLGGAVVAIGNAPTTLFRLLELLASGEAPAPACILAFPVGFVGAAESKQALIERAGDIPFLTLRGRRGGSAMAAAAVNAAARAES